MMPVQPGTAVQGAIKQQRSGQAWCDTAVDQHASLRGKPHKSELHPCDSYQIAHQIHRASQQVPPAMPRS